MATHTSHFKLTQSFVCAQVGVFYWLEIATGLRKTHTNSIFYFSTCGFGALHSQKCYVMFQCYLTKSELWIRFDQVCLFSDFSCLFGVLGPGFASYGSNVYLILEQSSENINLKNIHCEFMNNKIIHVRKACCPYKAFEYMQNAKFV